MTHHYRVITKECKKDRWIGLVKDGYDDKEAVTFLPHVLELICETYNTVTIDDVMRELSRLASRASHAESIETAIGIIEHLVREERERLHGEYQLPLPTPDDKTLNDATEMMIKGDY